MQPPRETRYLEAEVLYGLKTVAIGELYSRLRPEPMLLRNRHPEYVQFFFFGALEQINALRTVKSVELCRYYPIRRPKALLGDQYLRALLDMIETVRAQDPEGSQSFRLSAAGRHSAVLQRLIQAVSRHTGLAYDDEKGDLRLRIRPARLYKSGWEVLCRVTPRPLSARPWRVYNMPGALDATIAAAMILLSHPKSGDRVLNFMCGSGTLLIERLLLRQASAAVGCDTDSEALAGAQRNAAAAGVGNQVQLLHENATRTSFAPRSFDVLLSDLPWGQLVGSAHQNQALYPQVLMEAARIAAPGARCVLLTHQARLLEAVLSDQRHLWRVHQVLRLRKEDLRPRVYLLQRLA